MKLKNHPLEEENSALKKRLKEEQEKYQIEIERWKTKLYEQTVKTDNAVAEVARLTAKSTYAELRLEEEQDKYRIEIERYKAKLYEQTIKTDNALAEVTRLTAKSTHAELRLKEEQDKYDIEIERCKTKLYEQTLKTKKASAQVAHLKAKSTHAELLSEQKTLVLPKVLANIETQTEELRGKYNDLENIIRHRCNLEEKVEQKENSDGNSMSLPDAFTRINKQNDSLTKELALVKEKYEMAKIVLYSRRGEIAKLRAQLEKTQ